MSFVTSLTLLKDLASSIITCIHVFHVPFSAVSLIETSRRLTSIVYHMIASEPTNDLIGMHSARGHMSLMLHNVLFINFTSHQILVSSKQPVDLINMPNPIYRTI